MKVHNKGQVVIPAHIRKQLGIDIGDMLDVEILADEGTIALRVPDARAAQSLGGSLKQYARGKRFPTKRQMAEALQKGFEDHG